MTNQPATPKRTPPRRLARWLQMNRGWRLSNGWRRRILDLLNHRHPWWDWGHRVMVLVGKDDGGNWGEPEPPTWFYRLGAGSRMRFTGYPVHPLSTIEVIKDYATFHEHTKGLNEDELYEWKAICVNQDGELQLGKQFWGGTFFGLNRWETRLLAKYLRRWRRLDWWGARTWLYLAALQSAVNQRKPFSCQATPARDSNGYNHWHCELPKRHAPPHRYHAVVWRDGDRLMTKAEATAPST